MRYELPYEHQWALNRQESDIKVRHLAQILDAESK